MSDYLIDEDTDLLAGEFVLGTLDSEERANAQSLLRTDHGFIAMVRIWERRFGELHLMVEPVEPDAKIFQRIKAKIAEISPAGPAPDGKPPAEVTPSPQPPDPTGAAATPEVPEPEVPEPEVPKPEVPEPETPGPADVATEAATPKPPDAPAEGAMPKPADVPVGATAATGEPATPAAILPAAAPVIAKAAEIQPGSELRPLETVAKSERGIVKTVIAAPLTPQPIKAPDQPPDRFSDQRQERRPGREITIDVIRSRRRWRAFGVGMTVLLTGLVAILAAWRFVPDRLPAVLRPANLMMSVGIDPGLQGPRVKPAPPESQFDE